MNLVTMPMAKTGRQDLRKPLIYMYSGQGAQYYQMGKELYQQDPVFRDWMNRCSEMIAPEIGVSLVELIYRDRPSKYEPFNRTLYTHPAVVMFSYCLTKSLESRGLRPDYLLGYSLGEYTMAMVAGAVPLEEGLKRVAQIARIIENKCETGGMMAILESPDLMQEEPVLFSGCWLSCTNFAGHFVVTGRQDQLKTIEKTLFDRGITAQMLPISHGFHSPLIDPAESDTVSLFGLCNDHYIPTISSYLTGRITRFTGEHLWHVTRRPVRFIDTIRNLEASGTYAYVDLGPSGTLSTFLKYIISKNSGSVTATCVNQFGKDLKTMDMMMKSIGL